MWQLEFVGVGSAFSKHLGNNNAMFYYGSPENGFFLIDCGEQTRLKLYQQDLLQHLRGVFITHLHGDHMAGLEMCGYLFRYLYKKRLPIWLPSEEVLKGFTKWCHSMMDDNHSDIFHYFEPMVMIAGRSVSELTVGTSEPSIWAAYKVADHVPGKECFGILLTVEGRNHYFTADQRLPYPLHTLPKLDNVWHDCQLAEPAVVHAHIDMLQSNLMTHPFNGKFWLMHYSELPEGFEKAVSWCSGFVQVGQKFIL